MTGVYARCPTLRAGAEFVVVLASAELLMCKAVGCGFSFISGIEDPATTWPVSADGVCSGAPESKIIRYVVGQGSDVLQLTEPTLPFNRRCSTAFNSLSSAAVVVVLTDK
jgi:hypothetical protein